MESNSLKNIPQDQELRIIINKPIMKPQPTAKASCKNNNTRGDQNQDQEEDIDQYHLWPYSRAYTCGFCKRQFRSAQALGGHMNVHRRDRAKLRRSSPPLDSTHHLHHFHGSSSSSSSAQPIKFLKLYDFSNFNDGEEESDEGGFKIWNKVKKFVNKETTGLLGSSNEIDLELRLGF